MAEHIRGNTPVRGNAEDWLVASRPAITAGPPPKRGRQTRERAPAVRAASGGDTRVRAPEVRAASPRGSRGTAQPESSPCADSGPAMASAPSGAPCAPPAAARWDAPAVHSRARGTFPADLTSSDVQQRALADLERDVLSNSNRRVVEGKLNTAKRMIASFGLPFAPPTLQTIRALGAALKYGGYTTAVQYLSHYKVWCERNGYEFSASLARAHTDAVRSCTRGLGGPVKAQALRFDSLHLLDGTHLPWVSGGPLGGRNAMVLGCWFLMREVELSTARAAAVGLDKARREVSFYLPASKTDTQALGVRRAHRCSCPQGGAPSPRCPFHAAWDQLLMLQRRFGSQFVDGSPSPELLLFPREDGTAVSKESMAETIRVAATAQGIEAPLDGSERVSGHSLRVTGAQGLAQLGVDMWAIQLLGRWGSEAVRGYVRDTLLARAAGRAASAARNRDLDSLVAEVLRRLEEARAPSAAASSSESPVAFGSEAPAAAAARAAITECSSSSAAPTCTDAVSALAVQAQVAGARPSAVCPTVFNAASQVWHRVALGPPACAKEQWVAMCGWQFGRSATAQVCDEPPDVALLNWRALCSNCYGQERRAGKDRASAAGHA